jgi:uncharacterized repeat protein (TIGR01451 family)
MSSPSASVIRAWAAVAFALTLLLAPLGQVPSALGAENPAQPAPGNADLALTASDSPDPVSADQVLTYSLSVRNEGPGAALGVAVTDTLPAGVAFESAASSQGDCALSAGKVTCTLGTLDLGSEATVHIMVRPQAAGLLTNEASVISDLADPNLANNTVTVETTATALSVLTIDQSAARDGSDWVYTIIVTNEGPSDATGVVVTDTLPTGVGFNDALPSQGSCSESGGTVTCGLGTVAVGLPAVVYIKVRFPGQAGTFTNRARVSAETTPNVVTTTLTILIEPYLMDVVPVPPQGRGSGFSTFAPKITAPSVVPFYGLNRSTAISAAKTALRVKYRRAYTRGTRKRLRCKGSGKVFNRVYRCAYSFRSTKHRHAGTVIVRRVNRKIRTQVKPER